MHYVYILRSEKYPARFYVGETSDLRGRFSQHNAGKSLHTAKYRPWKLIWYAGFADHAAALRFEVYLKTASGRIFQKKHLAEDCQKERSPEAVRPNQSPWGRHPPGFRNPKAKARCLAGALAKADRPFMQSA